MTTRVNTVCRIFGHRWDPVGAEYYCSYHCERCGQDGYSDGSWRERLKVRLWMLRQRFDDATRRMRDWMKCPECGLHFGKHDDNYDHLPF